MPTTVVAYYKLPYLIKERSWPFCVGRFLFQMEKGMEWEQMTLLNELKQGRELTKQLKNHLNPTFSSPETRQFLIERILSSYEKALSMLNWSAIVGADSTPSDIKTGMLVLSPSSSSLAGSSPRSEGSDLDCKGHNHRDVSKKRKTLPRWSEQVRICSENGQEGPHDDGYSWRKYGQKDILGAIHPRGYYRCTHRNVQGCLATKQVQRSDEDPTIFEITYRGRHTCIQASHLTPKIASSQEKQEPKQNKEQEILISFGAGLKVKTEDLDNQIFPSFTFPSTPIESENVDGSIFSPPLIMGDPNNFVGSFSPAFISPATSESNYFSVSPNCHMNSFGMGKNVHTSESDLTEIISAPTSVTNSPIGDLDFSLGPMEFDSYFPFDSFFS